MKNDIKSPISGLDLQSIDNALPFEGKDVWIWHISKLFRSYGHWNLTLDIEIEGQRKTLIAVTTNSQMIDNWDGSDDDDYIGKLAAVEVVVNDNEERLLEMTETEE